MCLLFFLIAFSSLLILIPISICFFRKDEYKRVYYGEEIENTIQISLRIRCKTTETCSKNWKTGENKRNQMLKNLLL